MSGPLPLISAHQTQEWLQQREAILIDVRHLTSYKALHIANSLHAPDIAQIPALIATHPTERVILLCHNGAQAMSVSAMLRQQHNSDIDHILFYVLDGGLNGWRNAHLPLVRDSGNHAMPLDRQVQIALGIVLLVSLVFGWLFSSLWFIFVFLIALGLILSGMTGWYGFQQLILMMPWNKQ